MISRTNTKQIVKEHGLTFIELVVVLSIFGIMASIVLFRFDDFTARVKINNLAQDVALYIVGAQKAATSGAANASVAAGIAPTYGMYFKSGATAGSDNTHFTYFNDLGGTSGNRQYDAPAGSGCTGECLSVTQITTGEYISEICYVLMSGSRACTNSGDTSITFTRPFADATIFVPNPAAVTGQRAREVYIELSTPASATMKRTIGVTSLGKVWVYEGVASVYGVL